MSLNDALPRGITEQNKNMTDYERYLSGYEHGYDDQQLASSKSRYINQEGTGFGDHTDYFNLGYTHGFMGVSRALEVVIKTRYDRTGEENAALAAKSMSDTWDKAFSK